MFKHLSLECLTVFARPLEVCKRDRKVWVALLDPVSAYIIHKGHPVAVWLTFVLLSATVYIALCHGKVLSNIYYESLCYQ